MMVRMVVKGGAWSGWKVRLIKSRGAACKHKVDFALDRSDLDFLKGLEMHREAPHLEIRTRRSRRMQRSEEVVVLGAGPCISAIEELEQRLLCFDGYKQEERAQESAPAVESGSGASLAEEHAGDAEGSQRLREVATTVVAAVVMPRGSVA
ncbi:hypothetical protein GW17_00044837 [Ensete ventricosum]|nr:hypothetical protein GW17_00044837 [Ensete ventricosum]